MIYGSGKYRLIETMISTPEFLPPSTRNQRRLDGCCAADCFEFVSLMIKHCQDKYLNVIATGLQRGDPLNVLLDSNHCNQDWIDLILSVPTNVQTIDAKILKRCIRKCERKKLPKSWSDKIKNYLDNITTN